MKTTILDLLERQFLGRRVRVTNDRIIGRDFKLDVKEGVLTSVGTEFDDHHTDPIYFEFDDIFDNRIFIDGESIIETLTEPTQEVKEILKYIDENNLECIKSKLNEMENVDYNYLKQYAISKNEYEIAYQIREIERGN